MYVFVYEIEWKLCNIERDKITFVSLILGMSQSAIILIITNMPFC